ncbi:MAG: hypothetical protein J0L75_05915 [Spirochaetes bacterium]|nr:hypothetical protein [Spirochaetota bacterium]
MNYKSILFIAAITLGNLWAAVDDAFVRVSPRDPRYFELTDGTPYIPIGINLIHPPFAVTNEAEGLRLMDNWMTKLEKNGANYIRVWYSINFWDIENEKFGEYSESQARRIDSLLTMARSHHIRVKATFEHFRQFSQPGKWHTKANYGAANGGPYQDVTDFLMNTSSRELYKKKLDWYQARYGNDPVIFGYELWNEMENVAGTGWEDWTKVFLGEVKKRFPKNLAMQSLGSLDLSKKIPMYESICSLAGNEVAQVHRYLDPGAEWEVCQLPMDQSLAQAVGVLRGFRLAKPILVAESGAVEAHHSGESKLYAKDKQGMILHDVLFAPFFSGAAGTGYNWHWYKYVDPNNLWWHFGRFAAAVKDLDPPAEKFEVLSAEQGPVRVYALRGKRTLLIWCRDAGNTWKTELQEGKAPEVISRLILDVGLVAGIGSNATVKIYDPWKDRWADGAVDANRIRLPDFSRSIVIRVSGGPFTGATKRVDAVGRAAGPSSRGIRLMPAGELDIAGVKLGVQVQDSKWKASRQMEGTVNLESSVPTLTTVRGQCDLRGLFTLTGQKTRLEFAEQVEWSNDRDLRLDLALSGDDVHLNAVVYSVYLPVEQFKGRELSFDDRAILLPEGFSGKKELFSGICKGVRIPTDSGVIHLRGDLKVKMQDDRKFNESTYQIRFDFEPADGLIRKSTLQLSVAFEKE